MSIFEEIKNIKKDIDPTQEIKQDLNSLKDSAKVFEKEIKDLSSMDHKKK